MKRNSNSRLFISAVGIPPTFTSPSIIHVVLSNSPCALLSEGTYLRIVCVVIVNVVEELRSDHHTAEPNLQIVMRTVLSRMDKLERRQLIAQHRLDSTMEQRRSSSGQDGGVSGGGSKYWDVSRDWQENGIGGKQS